MMLVLWHFPINGVQDTSQIITVIFDWKNCSVFCSLGLQKEKVSWKSAVHSQNASDRANSDKQERKGRLYGEASGSKVIE